MRPIIHHRDCLAEPLSRGAEMSGLHGQFLRFLIVGFSAVAIDFFVYRVLFAGGLDVHGAKAISFIVGAAFAYVANRRYTFQLGDDYARSELFRFAAVYAVSLLANVIVNFLFLATFGRAEWAVNSAFFVATALSATMNFIGMKWLVFHTQPNVGDAGLHADVVSASIPATLDLRAGGIGSLRFSLVIPCYNEADNLPLLVQRLREGFVEDIGEVILVDNGSTDHSPDALAQLLLGQDRIRSIRVDVNQGYGHGILAGLRAAKGDVLGWTHADLQTDPVDALRALALYSDAGAASLFVKGRRHGRPFGDVVFTVGMSLFETALMQRMLWDINAQPTLFPRAFFERWRNPPNDFSLDLYAYFEAARCGLTVRRIGVLFGTRVHGTSHWNVDWKSKLRFIRRTIDFSLRLRREHREPT